MKKAHKKASARNVQKARRVRKVRVRNLTVDELVYLSRKIAELP